MSQLIFVNKSYLDTHVSFLLCVSQCVFVGETSAWMLFHNTDKQILSCPDMNKKNHGITITQKIFTLWYLKWFWKTEWDRNFFSQCGQLYLEIRTDWFKTQLYWTIPFLPSVKGYMWIKIRLLGEAFPTKCTQEGFLNLHVFVYFVISQSRSSEVSWITLITL